MEVRELLSSYEFPGDDIPIVKGSALAAIEGGDAAIGSDAIKELMAAVDEYIPQPERPVDQPFLMPIEDVFSISGRGTVVTGRVERGVVNVGDEIEIVGIRETTKTTCTGVEMFRKILDRGEAGDNVGCLLRGTVVRKWSAVRYWRRRVRSRRTRVQVRGLCADEGRGRSSHAVLLELPSAVLLPYDGCDGFGRASERHRDGDAGRQHRDDGDADRADRDG